MLCKTPQSPMKLRKDRCRLLRRGISKQRGPCNCWTRWGGRWLFSESFRRGSRGISSRFSLVCFLVFFFFFLLNLFSFASPQGFLRLSWGFSLGFLRAFFPSSFTSPQGFLRLSWGFSVVFLRPLLKVSSGFLSFFFYLSSRFPLAVLRVFLVFFFSFLLLLPLLKVSSGFPEAFL